MVKALVDIRLNLNSGKTVDAIRTDIAAVDNDIQWISLVFGDYDAVACIESVDAKAVGDVVLRINRVSGVASTNTRILF